MRERRIYDAMPDDLMVKLSGLGSDISAARRARHMSQEDLAQRMNVGRRTVARMEQGDHRVSLGAFMTAAWIMGLENNLLSAFGPDVDAAQRREARLGLPKRIDGPRPHVKRGGARPADEPQTEDSVEDVSADDNGLDF